MFEEWDEMLSEVVALGFDPRRVPRELRDSFNEWRSSEGGEEVRLALVSGLGWVRIFLADTQGAPLPDVGSGMQSFTLRQKLGRT